MTDTEIIEGNNLIAEFMQEPYIERGMIGCVENTAMCTSNPEGLVYERMQYHSSWNWLMPVVDKIIDIDITPAPNWSGYRIEIVPRGYVKISGFPMPTITTNVSIEGSLISATFKAVVEFAKWYNSQKTA